MIARSIAVSTHGRYLVDPPRAPDPAPLLVGFHGYAEAAEHQLDRLRAIPGAADWIMVSVQALHRFYRGRSEEVGAGWMTRQDRELAIADNVAYVDAVLDAVVREWPVRGAPVFAGFSQGAATAFRAAAMSAHRAAGVIACGGDVPPELDATPLARTGPVLLGRGLRDDWYTAEKLASDVQRLRGAGADVVPVEFDGAHEWSAAFMAAASAFLGRMR